MPLPPHPISLKEHFSVIVDPRVDRTKAHLLEDILLIALLAMLCGAEGFVDFADFGRAKEAWLRTFLRLPNGIPSHDTFGRVFAALDPRQFAECFRNWTETTGPKACAAISPGRSSLWTARRCAAAMTGGGGKAPST